MVQAPTVTALVRDLGRLAAWRPDFEVSRVSLSWFPEGGEAANEPMVAG